MLQFSGVNKQHVHEETYLYNLVRKIYIYISELRLKFHSFIFYSFILMQINVNA